MTFPASFYFHEILSPEKTEELLNEDQSYLVRRSPLNPDKFILSYLVDKRIKHEIVENDTKVRKNISFQDVSGVIEEMVKSNKNCVHAVVPPPTTDGSKPKSRDEILARKMKLPFNVADIINFPEDSFNDLLTRPGLSPKQIEVCHEIRRRGQLEDDSEESSEDSDDEDDGEQNELPSTSSTKTKRKKPSFKTRKKHSAGKNASQADKEAQDASRTSKEETKKKAKLAIKKAKLATVEKNTKVDRGRNKETQPQCYVCHQTFDNKRKLYDHLNSHRVRKCEPCGVYVSAKNFSKHSKVCSDSPKLKCDHCDFKTHYKASLLEHAKVHSREKFPCSTCGKQFGSKERLAAHEDCHERGLKCSKCPEVFKTVGAKYWHFRKKHMNKTIRNTAGFFSIDSSFLQQTEGIKKSPKVHRCDQCPYKSSKRSNFSRHKLSHSKPKKEKKIGVYRCVKGCHYYTKNTFNFNRHIETCRRFKATRPKTRPLITKRHVCNIANRVVISNKKMKSILRALRDVIGEDMFEKGIDTALSENLNHLSDDYVTTQLEYKDSDGNTQTTAFVCVKDINDIIAKVIRKRKIKEPLVVVGSDGGQGKVICSLQIHDLSKKGKDSDGLEPGGRRRVILLAAADGVKEDRELTDHFCQSLKLWTVTQEMIVIGDAKMTNCCLGEN